MGVAGVFVVVYDPQIGRFLSADPYIQSPYNTQSYNRYSYVMNNPLKYTDPSGYWWNPFKAIAKASSYAPDQLAP
jgi:RHS repeat-associated protein